MAGIVASLEAHVDICLLRQPVDDLALPLVAPLGADDDNIGHFARIPCNSSGFQHDLFGKPVSTFPDHGLACPAKSRPGPFACKAAQSDKGSAGSKQARREYKRRPV